MSQSTPAQAARRLRGFVADGIEFGHGQRLTNDLAKELRRRALDLGQPGS